MSALLSLRLSSHAPINHRLKHIQRAFGLSGLPTFEVAGHASLWRTWLMPQVQWKDFQQIDRPSNTLSQ